MRHRKTARSPARGQHRRAVVRGRHRSPAAATGRGRHRVGANRGRYVLLTAALLVGASVAAPVLTDPGAGPAPTLALQAQSRAPLTPSGTAPAAAPAPGTTVPGSTPPGAAGGTAPPGPTPAAGIAPASGGVLPPSAGAGVGASVPAQSRAIPRPLPPPPSTAPRVAVPAQRVPAPTPAPKPAPRAAPQPRPRWVHPMPGGRLTSCYGMRWGALHAGVDLAAPAGTPVYAVGAGRVVSAGWKYSGYGISVLVDHGNGYLTHYAHLSSAAVRAGQRVTARQRIGAEGSTGDSTGPHLHFEVHRRAWQNAVEPTDWLRDRGIDVGCRG